MVGEVVVRVYYNEISPYCCAWLRNLMRAGEIPLGDVDDRDIRDVLPSDVAGYDQCHFFAGLGGWPYALRLAGWDRPCWTGSCPCGPFSEAGKRLGFTDERHLWPAWQWHIGQQRPCVIFGEQVASPLGYEWLDLVLTDLEGTGYTCGASVLPAAGVGAPHGRHRLWFVADANRQSKHACAQYAEVASPPQLGISNANGKPLGRVAEPRTERGHWGFESGLGLVADGVPARVDKLRAIGNSLVPGVGAAFVSAYMAWLDEQ